MAVPTSRALYAMDYYVLTQDRSIFRRTHQGWQRLASSFRNNGVWLSSPGPDGNWIEAGWFDTPPNNWGMV